MRPHVAPEIHHLVDGHRLAKAFYGNLALVPAHNAVFDQREGLIRHQNLAWFRQGLQSAGEVHFLADNGVIHPVFGAEVTNRGVAGTDAHADFQGRLDAQAAPFLAHDLHVFAHLDGHGHTRERIFFLAATGRIAKEHHDGIADKLVDGAAVFQGDL